MRRPLIPILLSLFTLAHEARADEDCRVLYDDAMFGQIDVVDTGEGMVVLATDAGLAPWVGTVDPDAQTGYLDPVGPSGYVEELLAYDAVAGGGGSALLAAGGYEPGFDQLRVQRAFPDSGVMAPYVADVTRGVGDAAVAYDGRQFLVAYDVTDARGSTIWITRIAQDGSVLGKLPVATVPARTFAPLRDIPMLFIAVGGGVTYVGWSGSLTSMVWRLDPLGAPLDAAPIEFDDVGVIGGIAASDRGALVLTGLPDVNLHRIDPTGAVVRTWTAPLERDADIWRPRPIQLPLGDGVVHEQGGEVRVTLIPATDGETPVELRLGPGRVPNAVAVGGELVVVSAVERPAESSGYDSQLELRTMDGTGIVTEPVVLATSSGSYLDDCESGGCTAAPGRGPRNGTLPLLVLGAFLALAGGSGRLRRMLRQ